MAFLGYHHYYHYHHHHNKKIGPRCASFSRCRNTWTLKGPLWMLCAHGNTGNAASPPNGTRTRASHASRASLLLLSCFSASASLQPSICNLNLRTLCSQALCSPATQRPRGCTRLLRSVERRTHMPRLPPPQPPSCRTMHPLAASMINLALCPCGAPTALCPTSNDHCQTHRHRSKSPLVACICP